MSGVASLLAPKGAALLESAMHKPFMRHAHVTGIEDVGTSFRIITLAGAALRMTAWTPGDKIQIQLAIGSSAPIRR